jgi:small subunit ribosomal protein S1
MAVDENPQADQAIPENYEDFLEDYSHFAPPAADEVLQGTVLSISAKDVIIDFGYKSEGLVPIEQFQTPAGELSVHVGDAVDVMIEHGGGQPEGYVLLSHTHAARLRIWDNLDKAFQDQLVLSGRVLGRVKGGLAVDVGVKAFMPGSQADPRPVHNLDSLAGQDIPVKIIKLNRRRGNVVVSRKLAVEEEINVRKDATLEHLSEGAVVVGIVKNLTEYGAFIDLGGIDGLLHVTDLSYGRVTHPAEVLHVGGEVTVKVLKFDRSKERVSLGMKQLEPDPWQTVVERYPVNARVIGRVVNVTDYGAFVELEAGVEGLIHISEMTWSRRMKHPSKVVRPGDQVEAVVLETHPKDRRISLGLKQLEPNPWTTVDSRYSVG